MTTDMVRQSQEIVDKRSGSMSLMGHRTSVEQQFKI